MAGMWSNLPATRSSRSGTSLPEEGTPDSVPRADQWQWTMRTAECALAIRERLANYKVENANLYLKLAVSTGSITTAHVGGVFNRWEFLVNRQSARGGGDCQQPR
ncbi:MAG: hypothetical protein MZU97_07555 [Bacillus subtilis]|nr:hypothetical protein [Bacillus subtilis]